MTRTAETLFLALAIAACLFLIGHAAWGQAKMLCENPLATDGDSLLCGATKVRLDGVDSPELAMPGGPEAAKALRYLLGSVRPMEVDDALDPLKRAGNDVLIVCTRTNIDRFGRTVAICHKGRLDIGAWMVRSGWAWDWPAFSRGRYAAEQEQARSDRLGIWAGEPEQPPQPPWQYRARHK